MTSDFSRDTDYWNLYYEKNSVGAKASSFALKVYEEIETEQKFLNLDCGDVENPIPPPWISLLDLGCGNGRDSLFFLEKGLKVTAVDASDVAIKKLSDLNCKNANFICGDFVSSPIVFSQKYNYCYSRFSIHAITAEQEDLLLTNVKKSLHSGGKFFIEVRSVHDELFGKGECVGKNSFVYDGHFRRFVDKNELETNLIKKNFKILYSEENINFAPFGKENPPIIRIIVSA